MSTMSDLQDRQVLGLYNISLRCMLRNFVFISYKTCKQIVILFCYYLRFLETMQNPMLLFKCVRYD